MELTISRIAAPKAKPQDETKLGFGKVFSDHMFMMEYEEGKGWYNARIQPYQSLQIDPASPVLHYSQEIFEGLKAYRSKKDEILLFRARDNARRFNKSAERMCMPQIDVEDNYRAMAALVDLDRDWVPHAPGATLYLRPTLIADGSELGVHRAKRFLYFIICSPSGAYYPSGLAPIRIYVEDNYVRAVKGGTGFAKTGGNYAASLKAAEEAAALGYTQVLWLDGVERKYVEEVGAMNMMFLLGDTICTAPIEGSILDGITRKSILTLATEMGFKVEERRISISELVEAGESGELKEAFGVGTAAVVSPVGELHYKGKSIIVNSGRIGDVTQKLYDTLTGIQFGDIEDNHGWVTRV